MIRHKNKIIAGVIIVAALAVSFALGTGNGNSERSNASQSAPEEQADDLALSSSNNDETTISESKDDPDENSPDLYVNGQSGDDDNQLKSDYSNGEDSGHEQEPQLSTEQDSDLLGETNEETTSESLLTDPQTPPEANDPEDLSGSDALQNEGSDGEMTITLIITCATILDNLDRISSGSLELVPENGVIFIGEAVFYEGESVFNILQRETRRNRIHMEFMNSPIYNSAYIEGINNIYEFDLGDGSGWMYSVNGVFPNYGSSRYTLEIGDVVMWQYTCDRGADIGGSDASDSYNFG